MGDMTIEQILVDSPIIPGSWDHKSGKKNFPMAFFSVGCCWWTSFPEDLGSTVGGPAEVNGKKVNWAGLPCCPHCGSVLMQGPLTEFIEQAKANPDHYGKGGIETFLKSHHRNSSTCHKEWDLYL